MVLVLIQEGVQEACQGSRALVADLYEGGETEVGGLALEQLQQDPVVDLSPLGLQAR